MIIKLTIKYIPGRIIQPIFLLIFLINTNIVISQNSKSFELIPIASEKIGINARLSQGRISDIAEDDRGLIWIGTMDGLNRYDGYHVKVFRSNPMDSTSINNNEILKIINSKQSCLWILTKTGINKFNTYLETFQSIHFPNDSSISYKINDIALDKMQNLWIATSDGLYFLEKGATFPVRMEMDQYFSNPQALEVDYLNQVLIGSEQAYLVKYNHSLQSVKKYFYPIKSVYTKDFFVFDIHEDQEKDVWVTYFNNGSYSIFDPNVFRLRKGSDQLELFDEYVHIAESGGKDTYFSQIRKVESRKGEVWFTAMSNGMAFIDKERKKMTYLPDYREFLWRREVDKNAIFFDSNNDLWIGTNGSGVSILPNRKDLFKLVNNQIYADFNINSVRSIFEFGQDIFIGGYSDLVKMNKKNNSFLSLNLGFVPYCMEKFPLDSDYIIIGTEGRGLVKYNPRNNAAENITDQWVQQKGYEKPWNWIFDIYNDGDSLYWCGARNGILQYNTHTEEVKIFQNTTKYKYGNVLQVYRDYSGNLLAASDQYGLLEFDNDHQIFKPFKCDAYPDFDFSHHRINHITQTKDSSYWFSTDQGLIELNKNTLNIINQEDGLLNDYIYAAIPDQENNLWLSSNDGLYKFNRSNRQIWSFSVFDGLQAMEFNTAAYFKSVDGTIYFGGIQGFNYFKPQDIVYKAQELPMQVIGFYLNNDEVHLDQETYHQKQFNVPADVEYFQIEFAALIYHANSKFRYKYKLNELHENWIDLGMKNEIDFHGLDPGNYTLEILVADHHGNWNKNPMVLHINVEAYIWEKIWFQLGVLLILGLLVLLILNYRYMLMKQQKFEIEKTVKERTMELSIVNDELRKVNQTKDKFFAIISHDIKNPLAAAQSVSMDLIDHMDEYSMEEQKVLLGILQNSTQHLLELLDNLRKWSMLQNKEIEPDFKRCELAPILNKSVDLFKASLHKKRIQIQQNLEEGIQIYIDQKMVETIFRNLISNAIKFSYFDSIIYISAIKSDRLVEIQIEDNGLGMTDKQVNNLFIPGMSQSLPGTDQEKGTGFGLLMVYEFVKINKGKIDVISVPARGTRFIVSLPLVS